MAFACEYKPEGGLELIPKDAFVAAKMRVTMIKFDPLMGQVWAMYMSRFEEADKIQSFKDGNLV
jgi:hypothetical protein